jgi:putative transposase
MAAVIELENAEWSLISGIFDPPGRPGAPATYPRREMVNAMLFIARTGIQWRYLPERYPPWAAVWQLWLRWRKNGAWDLAMRTLAQAIRTKKNRQADPSMVMIDG